MTVGLEDFCKQLSANGVDRLKFIRDIAQPLYMRLGGDAKYFLDKTPRYHLIADEVLSIFPFSKFIILWRNPLAVASSMMETWSEGRWNLHRFHIDLYKGLTNLINFYENNREKVLAIRFEDFVSDPASQYQTILKYLDLPAHDLSSTEFTNIFLPGRLGDQTGIKQYNSISKNSIDRWKATLSNPWRKIWARRYLNWIGGKRLSVMGYQLDELLLELNSSPISRKHLLSDIARIGYSYFYRKIDEITYR